VYAWQGLNPGLGLDKPEAQARALLSFGHGFEGLGSAWAIQALSLSLHITTARLDVKLKWVCSTVDMLRENSDLQIYLVSPRTGTNKRVCELVMHLGEHRESAHGSDVIVFPYWGLVPDYIVS
jgi:hypothetical protein